MVRINKLFVILFILSFAIGISFAQNNSSQVEKGVEELQKTMADSLRSAMDEFETQKKIEKLEIEAQIRQRLEPCVNDWIEAKEAEESQHVNSQIQQEWQRLTDKFTPPIEYYLRDFDYTIQNKNITETLSINQPYQAIVNVKESLYVEEPPLIGMPRSDHQYTASKNIKVTFEYDKDTNIWKPTSEEILNFQLEKGWPDAISNKVDSYFIPKE